MGKVQQKLSEMGKSESPTLQLEPLDSSFEDFCFKAFNIAHFDK